MWWLLGLAGLSFVSGWGIVSTRRVLYPEPHVVFQPPNPLPAHTLHSVTARDGALFNAWLLETPAPPRGRLLLCHGYYANATQVLGLAQGLRERGYEIVLFELRGHGERPGPCTMGLKEAEDAEAVIAWGHRRDGSHPLPLGMVGLSMGAAVACHVAFRCREVRAVVLDSVYGRLFPVLQRVIQQRYRLPAFPLAWVTWWSLQLVLRHRLSHFDPALLAPQLRQPLLAIQGGLDRRVPLPLANELYEAWGGPKERWFDPQIAHVGMLTRDPRAYSERLAHFFDRILR